MSRPPPVVSMAQLQQQLESFARAQYGADAVVSDLSKMEAGHAGLSFGFTVTAAGKRDELVLRLAPQGVRLRGNTDVYRQAPLLRALHGAGLAVPAVRWAGQGAGDTDMDWFDTPFTIVERRPGSIYFVWEPAAEPTGMGQDPQDYWRQAMTFLIELHNYDWRRDLSDWQKPSSLDEEIKRWDRIVAQSPEPA